MASGPSGSDAARYVSAQLDGYAAAWARSHTEVCEATAVRHEQSSAVHELRMECLDDNLRQLESLVRQLGAADAAQVERAGAVTLPSLRTCDDVALLREVVRPPEDVGRREVAGALAVVLADARGLGQLGRFRDEVVLLRTLEPQARALAHPPLLANVLIELARAEDQQHERASARAHYIEAAAAADAGHDERARVEALTRLAWSFANPANELPAAHMILALASGALAHAGRPPDLDVDLLKVEGNIALIENRLEAALEMTRRALKRQEELYGPADARLTGTLFDLASNLRRLQRYDEARAMNRRGQARTRR